MNFKIIKCNRIFISISYSQTGQPFRWGRENMISKNDNEKKRTKSEDVNFMVF